MKLLSRSQAKLLGGKFYFTGKPCKYGHVSERSTSNGGCRECRDIYKATHEYKAANKKYNSLPEVKAANKKYHSTLKCKAASKKYKTTPKAIAATKKYKADPKTIAARKKFNSTPEAKAARKKYNATPERKAVKKKDQAKYRLKITKATPTTMEQAKILGEKFYFTGEPCEYDHFNFRDTSTGDCCKCNVYFLKEVERGKKMYDEMF